MSKRKELFGFSNSEELSLAKTEIRTWLIENQDNREVLPVISGIQLDKRTTSRIINESIEKTEVPTTIARASWKKRNEAIKSYLKDWQEPSVQKEGGERIIWSERVKQRGGNVIVPETPAVRKSIITTPMLEQAKINFARDTKLSNSFGAKFAKLKKVNIEDDISNEVAPPKAKRRLSFDPDEEPEAKIARKDSPTHTLSSEEMELHNFSVNEDSFAFNNFEQQGFAKTLVPYYEPDSFEPKYTTLDKIDSFMPWPASPVSSSIKRENSFGLSPSNNQYNSVMHVQDVSYSQNTDYFEKINSSIPNFDLDDADFEEWMAMAKPREGMGR
ncbi:MAG: hypothetical protein K0R98_781 [Rickettsiaceae bacterium]|jgi:hypothetical protein|nr:hypothetical protein [Gammaproteobacteria bacterium]MCE3232524.1 hypothetical protein [Rickettsiaceae bacterium]